jgi:diguanylate cyclase (GGDEF)-like protein
MGPGRMSAGANRWNFSILVGVTAGILATAVFAIGVTVWWLRADAIRDAGANAENLASVLAEQTNRSIQSIDLMLNDIQERTEALGVTTPDSFRNLLRSEDTYAFLKERMEHLSQVSLIGLVDNNGLLVNGTNQWPLLPADLSDREYFRHFKNENDEAIYVTPPVIGRVSGDRILMFAKRLNSSNNEFLGVIAVGIQLSYFQHIYESIKELPDLSFLFLRKNGTVILRYPNPAQIANTRIPSDSAWYGLVARGGGTYRSPGYFDGLTRLVGVRPLRNYPLVIDIGVSETAALASWRDHAIFIGIGTLLALICCGFLLKTLNDKIHSLVDSERTAIDAAGKLKRANATIDAALNNMSQGLVMFDSSQTLVVCNQRYLEMYGLSPKVVRPGCSLRELLNHRAKVGSVYSEDITDDVLAAVDQGTGTTKIAELNDGRIICVAIQPIADGGWVATHEDVTEARRAEERISYAAHHDSLTGLPNRKLFSETLEQELKRARRGEGLAVLYLDLDHLKRVNDTLGHPIGDKLLKSVASRLLACTRDVDLVARLGGDEFAIIQTSLVRPSDAADLAMRVGNAIHEPFDLDGHQVTVDVSAGISIAPSDGADLDEMMKAADIALYEAKNTGRGTYRFYEKEMNERMQTRDKLERDLHSALGNGEFELFYQPVIDLKENKIGSFEALLRWHHPTRGLVSPAEFIPIAEDTSLIVQLGEWVLRTACAEAATWPEDIGVAVNVSSVQLVGRNLADVIVGAIASAGIQADRLTLEITESVFLENTFANLATLKRLHDLGVRFSMDDFGTGYSSLSYLLSFPFSKIKIDRLFIADLTERRESRAIVRAIVDLARSLKIRVVAEGVETERQLEQLRRLGCAEIQGYLFSAPRPAADIRQLLLANRDSVMSIVSRVA